MVKVVSTRLHVFYHKIKLIKLSKKTLNFFFPYENDIGPRGRMHLAILKAALAPCSQYIWVVI